VIVDNSQEQTLMTFVDDEVIETFSTVLIRPRVRLEILDVDEI